MQEQVIKSISNLSEIMDDEEDDAEAEGSASDASGSPSEDAERANPPTKITPDSLPQTHPS
jgi:hypothetical protein